MSPNNKNILETANAAILQGDYEGFLSFYSDDTKWTFVGDQILRGKEAVREWMKTAYIKPPQFSVSKLIAGGDYVTALGYITMQDEPGNEASYSYCDVWRFRDGRMVELMAFVIRASIEDGT